THQRYIVMSTPSVPVFGGLVNNDHQTHANAAPTPVMGVLNGVVAGTVNANAPQFGGAAPGGTPQFGGRVNNGAAGEKVDLDQALSHLPRAKQYPMPEVDGRFNPSFGRWGHYNLPDVSGENTHAYYPRATTIGKALEDS